MIDYTQIPLHIKLTERWKIDPEYDAHKYYRDMELKERRQSTTNRRPERTVPDSVIEFARRRIHGQQRRLLEIAGAVGMPIRDFHELVKYADKMERDACAATAIVV